VHRYRVRSLTVAQAIARWPANACVSQAQQRPPKLVSPGNRFAVSFDTIIGFMPGTQNVVDLRVDSRVFDDGHATLEQLNRAGGGSHHLLVVLDLGVMNLLLLTNTA
jgi:hypothetical protein